MNLSDVKLVTHKDCADGSACAVLFTAAGGLQENVIFTGANHTETDDVAESLFYNWSGPIWFVDVSVSEKMAETLARRSDTLLLDHHKSAIPLARFKFCKVDKQNSACGSKLFYEFLSSTLDFNLKKYRDFVDAVDDMDRWIRQIPGSDVIHTLYGVLGQRMFVQRFLKKPAMSLTQCERFLIEVDREKQKDYVEQKKKNVLIQKKTINGNEISIGFVVGGGQYRSVLGDAICNDPSLGVDIAVMIGGDYISFRSVKGKSNVDCSAIAELNGGGGHQDAAGCKVSGFLGSDLLTLAVNNIKFQK